nr:YbjN domain-containing protein [Corynebacterium lizhenjunii]
MSHNMTEDTSGSAAQSAADPDILPDTPITAPTLERIGEIFTQQGLQYRIEEHPAPEAPESADAPDAPAPHDSESEAPAEESQAPATLRVLRTGFSNAAIAMQIRNNTLVVDSVWRGQVPVSEGPHLLMINNQWNAEHFAPTLRFYEGQDHNQSLVVSAVRELHITPGVSRNQLGAFVMSTLNSVLEAFAWIEQHYPQLVTWEDPHHD